MGGVRRVAAAAFALLVALGGSACQPPLPSWQDIPLTVDADPYLDTVPPEIQARLESRLAERSLRAIGSRVEHLPPGVTWEEHLSWRDGHNDDMTRYGERIPEPDALVLVAEYGRASPTMFVIGKADETGKRLIVLTALTRPANR